MTANEMYVYAAFSEHIVIKNKMLSTIELCRAWIIYAGNVLFRALWLDSLATYQSSSYRDFYDRMRRRWLRPGRVLWIKSILDISLCAHTPHGASADYVNYHKFHDYFSLAKWNNSGISKINSHQCWFSIAFGIELQLKSHFLNLTMNQTRLLATRRVLMALDDGRRAT